MVKNVQYLKFSVLTVYLHVIYNFLFHLEIRLIEIFKRGADKFYDKLGAEPEVGLQKGGKFRSFRLI